MVAEVIKSNIKALELIEGFTYSREAGDELKDLKEANLLLLDYVRKLEQFKESTMQIINIL